MHIQLYMTSSLGPNYHTDLTFRDFGVKVQWKILPIDLVHPEIQEWDVIVEID